MSDAPEDTQYRFFSSAFRKIKIGQFVDTQDWKLADHKMYTTEDEEMAGGPEYERPYYVVTCCGVGGCSKKGWPTKAGAWSYCSDARARLCYARHLVKHGGHLFSHADALLNAFNYRYTHVNVLMEGYKQKKAFGNNMTKMKIKQVTGVGCSPYPKRM